LDLFGIQDGKNRVEYSLKINCDLLGEKIACMTKQVYKRALLVCKHNVLEKNLPDHCFCNAIEWSKFELVTS